MKAEDKKKVVFPSMRKTNKKQTAKLANGLLSNI